MKWKNPYNVLIRHGYEGGKGCSRCIIESLELTSSSGVLASSCSFSSSLFNSLSCKIKRKLKLNEMQTNRPRSLTSGYEINKTQRNNGAGTENIPSTTRTFVSYREIIIRLIVIIKSHRYVWIDPRTTIKHDNTSDRQWYRYLRVPAVTVW